jgi:predicted XRE-type DNA-binding protein
MKAKDKIEVFEGSGNVFADIGLPNAEEEIIKAGLMLRIYTLIRKRGLAQREAADILRIKQPHVSELMRGRASAFSIARLMKFLTLLGQDVQISVRPARRRKERGAVSVVP